MDQILEEFINVGGRVSYPSLNIFVRRYLRPMEGNDRKALSVFKLHETREATKRLQAELFSIKMHEASSMYLKNLIGDRKEKQHQGYDKWAGLLLRILPTIRDI